MFYAKNNEIFSLCTAVKYTHIIESVNDYLHAPRPCHNLVFILEGEGDIYTETDCFTVKTGDILIIPRETKYKSHWKANPKTVFHSLHFIFYPQNDPFTQTNIPVQKLRTDNFDFLYSVMTTFHKHQYSRENDSFFALSAFYTLLGEILPHLQHSHKHDQANPVSRAIEYLENNYDAHCTVEELAGLCFLSPSRFFYHFKKETGLSPIAYKNQVCIRHATQTLLLEKHKSIEEVSEEYGFESAVYFRRLFKSVTGKTPTQYRNEETLL